MKKHLKQNTIKLMQRGGNCSSYHAAPQQTFTLMTFNIFNTGCKIHHKTPKLYIENSDVDLICVQENNTLNNIDKYTKIEPNCGTGGESVNCFYKNDNTGVNSCKFDKCVSTTHIDNTADRSSIIIIYNGIKIANLHLEGGRNVDEKLKDNFDKKLKYKLQLLALVINENPDIICGDFNSVYSTNSTQNDNFLQSQYTYFEKINNKNKENIKKWNTEPFKLLLSNGYTYSIPSNETESITNNRGKSIVDTIWFKNTKIQLTNTKILNILDPRDTYKYENNCSYSDHNPVVTTVTYNDVALSKGGTRRHKKRLSLKKNKMHKRTKQNHKSRKTHNTHNTHNTQKRKKHNKQK